MISQLNVPARFNGPARSGNGGYVAGALAQRLAHQPPAGATGDTVEVTLRKPPPLDSALPVARTGDRAVLGDPVVAEARLTGPGEHPPEPVRAVTAAEAADAMLRYPGLADHPFPTCFACGPDRDEGDGLRIFPGPVGADPGHVASLWVPRPGHAEPTGPVDGVHRCGVAVTWASLDCVGGWSEDLAGRPCVLGRMTARLDALPVVGEPHVVVGRHLGRDGRKSFTASTLYDADGRMLASARHTWLQVDPAVFN